MAPGSRTKPKTRRYHRWRKVKLGIRLTTSFVR